MFLRRSLRPPVLEMEVQVGPKLMEIDNVAVAGYIHPQDWVTYDRFYELAKKYRGDYGFVMSPPDEGATGSLVFCHNNIEGEKHELVEMDAVDDLENFVKRCAQPTIPVLSRRKWEEAFQVRFILVRFANHTQHGSDQIADLDGMKDGKANPPSLPEGQHRTRAIQKGFPFPCQGACGYLTSSLR